MNYSISGIKEFCKENNIDLLYLTKFGSKLYGTDNENSDEDLKGIFLPSKESLLLNKIPRFHQFSTGKGSVKNTSDDIDVELYSIHNFLHMTERGDTGAIDLLFSYSNKNAVIFCDEKIKKLFENPLKFFNPLNTRAFMGYAQSQAKKYSIKGSYLNVLVDVSNWLDNHQQYKEQKLEVFINELLNDCENGNFCCKTDVVLSSKNGKCDALQILGSKHSSTIYFEELNDRIKTQLNKYGKRSQKAYNSIDEETKEFLRQLNKCKNKTELFINVFPEYKNKYDNSFTIAKLIEYINSSFADWKAISHAVRCVIQIKELLTTLEIKFPLKEKDYIKSIKEGKENFRDVIYFLDKSIEEVDYIINNNIVNKFDKKYIEEFILSFYKGD